MTSTQHADDTVRQLYAKLERYKSKNKRLIQQLTDSVNENKIKDKLLNERSQCIMRCRAENLRLKDEIKMLIADQSPPSKRSKSAQQFSELRHAQRKKAIETEPMPYMVARMPSSSLSMSCTMSEQACKISFPPQYGFDSKPPPIQMLTPIHEERGDGSPCTVRSSDNNQNIQNDEWDHCIAALSPSAGSHHTNYISDDRDDSTEHQRDYTDVSYMSENTDLWMDIHDNTPVADVSDDDDHFSHHTLPQNQTNYYTETSFDQVRGCDMVVVSPVIDFMRSKTATTYV
eukprot:598859_1